MVSINQTGSSSTAHPKDSNIVLAKPIPESDAQNNLPQRYYTYIFWRKKRDSWIFLNKIKILGDSGSN